ncbi:MAG: hypothetical protein R3E77_02995 [Steroidobacteraceae bacterium]
MSAKKTVPKAALSGPVTDHEPLLLHDVPMDNAVGAIVALTAEVHILRERLQTLEAVLAGQGTVSRTALERYQPDVDEALERNRSLGEFTSRVLSELARDRTPVAPVDPRVRNWLTDNKTGK